MRICTVCGTRPELIRLNLIIKKLDKYCQHVLIHTGQNFDDHLSKIFFEELDIRQPDYYLGIKSETFGRQVGKILECTQDIFEDEKPDRILILGDTNSGLSCIVAKRMGIPVYHIEAGNRCFDNRVPEETNRVIIDHCSAVNMPYTQRSKENLLREGISLKDIYVIGNPIFEVLKHFEKEIDASRIMEQLDIISSGYFLLTIHRAENVDDRERLENIMSGINEVAKKYKKPVICSLHPRTQSKLELFKIKTHNIKFSEPFGFFDFVKLEKNAACVITDSGTCQEETCIFGVPSVTIRDTTERQETVECGSSILCGSKLEDLLRAIDVAMSEASVWKPPPEYLVDDVSSKVAKIVLGT